MPVRAPPHTMPPVARLEAPPTYVVQEEHTELQSSTPNSFSDLPPLLVSELDHVLVKLQPVPAALSGDDQDELVMEGRLWVTEQSLSFLPSSSGSAGFQIPFPSIALHAVSRSVPDDVLDKTTDASAYSTESCIYCQLDDHPERDENEGEEEQTIFELWILKLFDALSHCAGLYPSANGADGGDAHPFSGFAPFGTGTDSDDNEEGDEEGDEEDTEQPAADDRETKRVRTEN